LRHDYDLFQQRGVEILALGPDGPNAFKRYWESEQIPFIGLPDIKSKVSDTYYQEVNLFKLGRMPAIFVIDRQGMIRYAHYGDSMKDIPPNQVILDVLDQLPQ
jgi:peroxiredoxin Q/BCP